MADEPSNESKSLNIRERLGGRSKAKKPRRASADGVVPPPEEIGSVAPPPGFVRNSVAPGAHDPYRTSMMPGGRVAPTAQQVRIVVDEDAVKDAQAGMGAQARRAAMIAAAAAVVIGLVLGAITTATMSSRRNFNRSVRDGKAIYEAVLRSSDQVAEASALVERAYQAAQTSSTQPTPTIDFAAIEALREAEVPFSATDFSGRQFLEFSAATVNSLFAYNTTISDLWDKFDSLAARTLPDKRREELQAAAADTGAVSSAPTGCVVYNDAGGVRCGLVFVQMPDEGNGPVKVQSTRGSKAEEKKLFTGGGFGGDPSEYVVLINPEASAGVLGTQRNAFVEYRKDLTNLKDQMAKAVELQGQLEKGVGEVASLSEIWAF